MERLKWSQGLEDQEKISDRTVWEKSKHLKYAKENIENPEAF